MLGAEAIITQHDEAILRWHRGATQETGAAAASDRFGDLLLAQHRANFDLWHQEDDARRPDASDARIAAIKHAIDHFNQRRNDLVEAMDTLLLREAGTQNEQAPLNSETPGLMIDRLSILALKIYHTAEETHRASAAEAHRQRNRERLDVLREQRSDLARCLDELWAEVAAGRRRFRLYRQLKMYNDPELNPAIYGSERQPGS
jgi:hypothetical protein